MIAADRALQRSLNVPAVLMLQQYGIAKFLTRLKQLNITTLGRSPDYYGLSLILGGGEVTLLELAYAYRNLALSVSHEEGGVFNAGAAFHTLEALLDLHRPDEEGNWKRFDSSIPIAWKTGTSYGHRDAWAVGVTPEVVIAAWVGNADGEGREGIVGSTTAGKLLFRIVNHLELSGQWFDPPYIDMQWMSLCSETGFLAGVNCPRWDTLSLASSVQRASICTFHKPQYVQADGQYSLNEWCSESIEGHWEVFFEMDPIAASYYRSNHPSYRGIPPLHPSCTNESLSREVLSFVYPGYGDQILLPVDLNGHRQKLVVEVVHQDPQKKIFWYLDEKYLGKTKEWHTMAIQPSIGEHRVTVVDEDGNEEIQVFYIVAQ